MNSTSRGRRLERERKSRRQTSKPNEVVGHTNLQQGAVVLRARTNSVCSVPIDAGGT